MALSYDSLEAINKAYLYHKAKDYVTNIHYDAYNYYDKEKTDLRGIEIRSGIDIRILECCERHSRELIQELKSLDIFNLDYDEMAKVTESKIDEYVIKINDKIDKIMSEVS